MGDNRGDISGITSREIPNNLYLQLGVDPSNPPYGVQELGPYQIDPDGIWASLRVTIIQYSEVEFKVKYEILLDFINHYPTSEAGQQKMNALKANGYWSRPLKEHWESVPIPQNLNLSIYGNEMGTKCINPDYVEIDPNEISSSVDGEVEKFLKEYHGTIEAIIQDIAAIAEGAAKGKAYYEITDLNAVLEKAKGSKRYQQLVRRMGKLKEAVVAFAKKTKISPNEIFGRIASAGKSGAPKIPATPVSEKAITNAVESIAKTHLNELKLAEEAKIPPGTRFASESETKTLQRLGKFSKFCKGLGYAGLGLQLVGVVFNGVAAHNADAADKENAMQTFTDSLGGFFGTLAVAAATGAVAGAVGGPIGVAIGVGMAVLDMLCVLTFGKGFGDYLYTAFQYVIGISDGSLKLQQANYEIDKRRGFHRGSDTKTWF